MGKRQIEPTLNEHHADRQIEQNDEHSPTYVDWQVEWQEQAEKQIEHSDGQSKCIDLPNNLVEIVKGEMNILCKTSHPPEFIFELSESAALHNLEILNKYRNELSKALRANENSSLGYGSEFRKLQELKKVFGFHPLWSRLESILRNRSKWPLEEITKEHRKRDLDDALSFGNHKVATAKQELLKKLINKDVIHGYSFPTPLTSVKSIGGLVMALMNIMVQNTINEHSQIIPKD